MFELFGDDQNNLVAKWISSIELADAQAQSYIIVELTQKADTYRACKTWEEVTERLKTSDHVKPLIETPLADNHDFGMAAYNDQFIPALTDAREAEEPAFSTDQGKVNLRSMGQYRRYLHEGDGPYAKPLKALQDQVFVGSKKAETTVALRDLVKYLNSTNREHTLFEPEILDVVSSEDGTQRTIEFVYKFQDDMGETKQMHFTCVQNLADFMTTSVKGKNLTLKPVPGRGKTETIATHQTNQDLNNAHLIADWFGGSGYKQSLNLITTSAHFNGNNGEGTMGSVEADIAEIVRGNDKIDSFDIEINVKWGEFLEPNAQQELQKLQDNDVKKTRVGRQIEDLQERIANFIASTRDTTPVPLRRCEQVQYKVMFKDESGKTVDTFDKGIGPDKWIMTGEASGGSTT